MEQTNNNYPKFEAGQVLTSKALNSYFGYLDEQQRLTRAKLLGVGIIDGLEFTYNDNAIIITKGTAVTSDGYLIELKEDATYTLAFEYDKDDMILKQSPLGEDEDKNFKEVLQNTSYVLYKDESDAMLHGLSVNNSDHVLPKEGEMKNYILTLCVDFYSHDQITKCSELSCDIIQTNYQTEIRPVLINKNIFPERLRLAAYLVNFQFLGLSGSISSNLKITSTDFYQLNASIKKGINDLSQFITTHISLFACCITAIQTNTNQMMGIRLSNNSDSGKESQKKDPIDGNYYIFEQDLKDKKKTTKAILNPTWQLLLDNPSSFLNRLLAFGNSFNKLGENIKKMSSYSDIYIRHLLDINLAMEEFVTYYNEFAGKYDMLPIVSIPYSRIVMLGDGTNSFHNLYRQHNDSVLRSKQFLEDRSLLQKHLERILLLSENFTGDSLDLEKQTIECTRQKPHAKLGECYIPNYYKNDDNFTKNWNAHAMFDVSRFIGFGNEGLYDFLFKSNSNFPKTTESTDLLVVNGYFYQNVDTVKTAIESYIKENGLAIEVETIEFKTVTIGQERMLKIKEIFKNVKALNKIDGWEQTLNDIVAKKTINSDKAKEMAIAIARLVLSYTLQNNQNKLAEKTHLNALLSYLNTYYNIPTFENIQMIGGCPYNGKLSLLYASGEKKKVLLIAGSANQLTESAFSIKLNNGLNMQLEELKKVEEELIKTGKEIETIKNTLIEIPKSIAKNSSTEISTSQLSESINKMLEAFSFIDKSNEKGSVSNSRPSTGSTGRRR